MSKDVDHVVSLNGYVAPSRARAARCNVQPSRTLLPALFCFCFCFLDSTIASNVENRSQQGRRSRSLLLSSISFVLSLPPVSGACKRLTDRAVLILPTHHRTDIRLRRRFSLLVCLLGDNSAQIAHDRLLTPLTGLHSTAALRQS